MPFRLQDAVAQLLQYAVLYSDDSVGFDLGRMTTEDMNMFEAVQRSGLLPNLGSEIATILKSQRFVS